MLLNLFKCLSLNSTISFPEKSRKCFCKLNLTLLLMILTYSRSVKYHLRLNSKLMCYCAFLYLTKPGGKLSWRMGTLIHMLQGLLVETIIHTCCRVGGHYDGGWMWRHHHSYMFANWKEIVKKYKKSNQTSKLKRRMTLYFYSPRIGPIGPCEV